MPGNINSAIRYGKIMDVNPNKIESKIKDAQIKSLLFLSATSLVSVGGLITSIQGISSNNFGMILGGSVLTLTSCAIAYCCTKSSATKEPLLDANNTNKLKYFFISVPTTSIVPIQA